MAEKQIQVTYFSILREKRGLADEQVRSAALTPAALYDELRALHNFPLDRASLGVAVNGDWGQWDSSLSEGDSVVFLPPVSGG